LVDTISGFGGEVAYAHVVNAERRVIRDLLAKTEPLVSSLPAQSETESDGEDSSAEVGADEEAEPEKESANASENEGYLILPVPGGVGFDVIRSDSADRSPIFQNPSPWPVDSAFVAGRAERLRRVLASGLEISGPVTFFIYDLHVHFRQEFDLKTTKWENVFFYYHYVLGRPLRYFTRDDMIEVVNVFNGLETLRGYPAIQAQLRTHTASLRDILRLEDEDPRPVELASLLLIEAFETHQNDLFFDQEHLRRLVETLRPFLATLDGETAQPAKLGWARSTAAGTSPNASTELFGVAWADAMPFVFAALFALALFFSERIWRLCNLAVRGPINYRLLTLARDSEDFLSFLQYSEGREKSAGLSLRGLSLGAKQTLTARDLTLQGLTDRYLQYVRNIQRYYNGKVIIAIDELDKVTNPEDVRKILLEIKGALFEKGCFYLISISEDAARAFRGRLTEGRDIFESSFDEVLEIPQMDADTAAEMIEGYLKTLKKDPPQLDDDTKLLLTTFGGGIPREIVRNVRKVSLEAEPGASLRRRAVAIDLFRSTVQEWVDHLPEIPTSGEEAIQLRTHALAVHSVLDDVPEEATWPEVVREELQNCLAIIDPKSLRLTSGAAEENGDGGMSRKVVLREVQYCLRLMIMDVLLTRLLADDPDWRESADAALACLRVLPDQPALAEAMLKEMRTSATAVPLREQTWRKARSKKAQPPRPKGDEPSSEPVVKAG
jgi:hypothetical protein